MMSAGRVDKLIWTCIYAGLLLVSLGLFVRHASAAGGWAFVGAGAVLVLAGVLLIWLRSRMKT